MATPPDPKPALQPAGAGSAVARVFPIALDLSEFDEAGPRAVGTIDRLLRSAPPHQRVVVDLPRNGSVDAAWAALVRTVRSSGASVDALVPPELPELDPPPNLRRLAVRGTGDPPALGETNLTELDAPEWAWRLGGIPDDPGAVTPPATGSPEYRVLPASLLDAGRLEEWDRGDGSPGRWIITDPFAGGRFDGRALDPGMDPRRPPRSGELRDLAEWIRPALPYGFLPIAGRRTLAQATLLFLLSLTHVAAVEIPVDRPETLEQALRLSSVPPLDSPTRARILSMAATHPSASDGRG